MPLKDSELILNQDGSIYHLNLKPGDVANTIIFVGDQERVDLVTKHFDTVEFETQKREFKTQTGIYNGKRISVISTGIGTDNIDIVLNELDALFNIDFATKTIKKDLTSLNIIRIGTSGALQEDIPIDSFLISSHALDLAGTLHAYQTAAISNPDIEDAFIQQTHWDNNSAKPLVIKGSSKLIQQFKSPNTLTGLTVTANGFYGPQGRILRLPLKHPHLNDHIANFNYNGIKITNLEMETSGIYGISKLLGHNAVSLNALIANRSTGRFSNTPKQTIENLITYTLQRI